MNEHYAKFDQKWTDVILSSVTFNTFTEYVQFRGLSIMTIYLLQEVPTLKIVHAKVYDATPMY